MCVGGSGWSLPVVGADPIGGGEIVELVLLILQLNGPWMFQLTFLLSLSVAGLVVKVGVQDYYLTISGHSFSIMCIFGFIPTFFLCV